MGDQGYENIEDGAVSFNAGSYLFTRAEARACYRLMRQGTSLWQLKAERHPNATLQEIVVGIQVAIAGQSFTIAELHSMCPHIFDVALVSLEVWNVGVPIEQ